MIEQDIIAALGPVVEVLEQLGIAYHVGGSVASSAHGIARTTLGVDLVADLQLEHVQPFVEALRTAYYVDAAMVEDAIRRQASFNLIHLPTMIKVDVFIPKGQAFDRAAFRRARQETLAEEDANNARPFYVASPEDVILRKLEWYKAGGGVSERQWQDVLGVLKVQAEALDHAYLKRWAKRLGLDELLVTV